MSRIMSFITTRIRMLATDENAGYEEVLAYKKTDSYIVKVLWVHLIVFIALAAANSLFHLASHIQSPLSWRVISDKGAFTAVVVAFCVTLGAEFFRDRLYPHFLYRILIGTALIIYSHLFVFISGGSVEMHFHFFLVLGLMAIYADWRLEWILASIIILFNIAQPPWVFAYGTTFLSPLVHTFFIIAMTVFMTKICGTYRNALIAQRELEKRKDEFISMASHELKTPVTSLKLFSQVMGKKLDEKETADVRRYLKKIDMQTDKLNALITDLLDITRIQTGKLRIEKEAFNLDALVDETVEEVRSTTTKHTFVIDGAVKRVIYADRYRIYQVLVNLLTNAVKYSPKGGKIIISTAQSQAENEVEVRVKDQGIGIEEQFQDKVFERLFQVDDPSKKTYPGLGVGLYISSVIVKLHGGRMWVMSEKGKGSTFHFSLPLSEKGI